MGSFNFVLRQRLALLDPRKEKSLPANSPGQWLQPAVGLSQLVCLRVSHHHKLFGAGNLKGVVILIPQEPSGMKRATRSSSFYIHQVQRQLFRSLLFLVMNALLAMSSMLLGIVYPWLAGSQPCLMPDALVAITVRLASWRGVVRTVMANIVLVAW